MRIRMTKRVLIGTAIALGIVLAVLLWVVFFQQKLPVEGTLV